MKKVNYFVILCLFFYSFLLNNIFCPVSASADTSNPLRSYVGEIKHVFTHCLLSDPQKALSDQNPLSYDYSRDCITKNEFKLILEHLYMNNFILIDPHEIYEVNNNQISRKKLLLPPNKKPLIFSFDDVNYDHKKMGHGMVDKLVVDKHGEIAAKTNSTISKDNEFVPILNAFVKKHPDFSFRGAKGVLCLTGYDGILGYRTQAKNKKNRAKEISECKKVVNKLKSDGWTFACHSFGHYHMKKIGLEKFKRDLRQWNDEVVPLIGKTDIYVYPYGEWEILDDSSNISKKHKLLMQDGFKLFCGVGVKSFISMLPKGFEKSEQILFMDRCPLDGYTIKNRGKDLADLFPYEVILDKYRK